MFTALWNIITGRASSDAPQLIDARIPRDRTDAQWDETPIAAGQGYFRLWLCDMYLTKSRAWFTEWHPAVHCAVKLTFEGRPAVSFSSVAKAPIEAEVTGVLLNFKLSELMPFNGGDVEIAGGLLALKGKSDLRLAINLLASFSSLVAPPLGQAISIANKVAAGVQDLVEKTHGDIHLPFHQAFVSAGGGGGNDLRPGYYAVLRATRSQVEPSRLAVRGDRLHYSTTAGAEPVPLTGYDYVLLRIEGRTTRDDWRFQSIVAPLAQAKAALRRGDEAHARTMMNNALVVVSTSPDFAESDRVPIYDKLLKEYEAAQLRGYGAAGQEEPDLNELLADAVKQRDALLHLSGAPVERFLLT